MSQPYGIAPPPNTTHHSASGFSDFTSGTPGEWFVGTNAKGITDMWVNNYNGHSYDYHLGTALGGGGAQKPSLFVDGKPVTSPAQQQAAITNLDRIMSDPQVVASGLKSPNLGAVPLAMPLPSGGRSNLNFLKANPPGSLAAVEAFDKPLAASSAASAAAVGKNCAPNDATCLINEMMPTGKIDPTLRGAGTPPPITKIKPKSLMAP